ncbi:MAG TPA: hypothetical protein VK419_17155 [Bryobacteraceae bacterium]|nr:hypothetical protein [Bryobacteraceae bacterium]
MTGDDEPLSPHEMEDEPPPVLGTWPRVYTFTLIYLALVIFAFYLFTVHFAP